MVIFIKVNIVGAGISGLSAAISLKKNDSSIDVIVERMSDNSLVVFYEFVNEQIGLLPIEDDRGPGRRTLVFIQGQREPFVASRSENAILRDMSDNPQEYLRSREQVQLLADILDTIEGIDPMLRTIVRDQGHWDLDRLEERIRDNLLAEEL